MGDRKINPALVAALEHYAEGRYDMSQPTTFVHRDTRGVQSAWPMERACAVAAHVLAEEELSYLKLRILQDGLRKHGMGALYLRIMGEPLPAA